jgi:hypothetical protein
MFLKYITKHCSSSRFVNFLSGLISLNRQANAEPKGSGIVGAGMVLCVCDNGARVFCVHGTYKDDLFPLLKKIYTFCSIQIWNSLNGLSATDCSGMRSLL